MKRLVNYLKEGKGRGLRAMLIFTILLGGFFWYFTSTGMKNILSVPEVQAFVQSIPDIEIKDGVVIKPANMNVTKNFGPIPLLRIQTDRDTLTQINQAGFYLTKKAFYWTSNGAVNSVALPQALTINQEVIQTALRKVVTWFPVLYGLFYVAIIWAFYLILVGVTALIGCVAGKMTVNKGTIWRLAMTTSIFVFVLELVLTFCRVPFPYVFCPFFSEFVICLILNLAALIALRHKATATTKNKKKKA